MKRLISEKQTADLSNMLGSGGSFLGGSGNEAIGWQSGLGLGAEVRCDF